MFNEEAIKNAKLHALECFPEESCGFIINGKYYPQKNIAKDKEKTFRIHYKSYLNAMNNIGDIECVIHSHNDFPHVSKNDLIAQENCQIPYGIININELGMFEEPFFIGDDLPIEDYIGRKFIINKNDCYGLARDYYRKEHNIILENMPRDDSWWVNGPSILLDNYKRIGFELISGSEIKEGDAIFMRIKYNVVNHCAVYIGDGLILHHLANRLSCRQPLQLWSGQITHFLRHKEL